MFLRNQLGFPVRFDVVLRSIQSGIVNQLLILFTGIQLVVNISLQVQIMLYTILEKLAHRVLRHITLIQDLFIEQVLYQRPLVGDDRNIQSGLAGNRLGGSISASGSEGNHNACGYSLLQRGLGGRGHFLIVVNQGIVNINGNQFVHLGSLLSVVCNPAIRYHFYRKGNGSTAFCL